MSTLVIDLAYGKAALSGESLHLEGRRWADSPEDAETVSRRIPLGCISHVMLCPQVTPGGALVQELLRRGTGITYMGSTGPLGELLPTTKPKGHLRLEQYRRSCDPEWRLRQARVLVATKIHNQAHMLKRRNNPPGDDFFREMKRLLKAVAGAGSTAELMGLEGTATARYFAEWARLLPPAFPFTGRTRRPPKDPVNACLGYLAAMCAADMLRALATAGLDPDLGVLHSTEDYRHNLVLDLMEPYRPVLVEGVTRDILAHGMLGPESTEQHEEDGGCYLSPAGRVTVIRRYMQRMESTFQYRDQPATLRQCMQDTARCWKDAVLNPDTTASNFKLT